nr:MAG TPA: hypothetical protein [Caudoviricetes sp.]DAX27267.1 MAG TPA: hypothetical protein [Caudoviricetes sp.]DAX94510.1 MAG TPA: hypothetical protein [Caudoviricetes sp.]
MLIRHTVIQDSIAGLLTLSLVIHIIRRIGEQEISFFTC